MIEFLYESASAVLDSTLPYFSWYAVALHSRILPHGDLQSFHDVKCTLRKLSA